MHDVMHAWVESLVSSPWVLLVVVAMVAVDGFFPAIPSEMLVITLATSAAAGAGPSVWLVIAAAAAGALLGDVIAYLAGRTLQVRRWRISRRPRVAAAFDWAEDALRQRPARFILTARFIPVGRVAVTMTAGATRLPASRFVPLVAVADVTWAVYSTIVGFGAGLWLGDKPLVAMAAGICGGLLLGYLVDLTLGRALSRRPTTVSCGEASEAPGHDSAPRAPRELAGSSV